MSAYAVSQCAEKSLFVQLLMKELLRGGFGDGIGIVVVADLLIFTDQIVEACFR